MPSEKHLVTCALPYANGPLHIGHIRSTYLTGDIYARYLRLKGKDVAFICATDEYGTPITVTAEKKGKKPIEVAKKYHDIIKKELDGLNIIFDVFSRTSSEENNKRAQEFFNAAYKKGHIHEKEVEQYYCKSCKRFLPDRYVEGTCPECGAEGARGDHCEKCAQHLDHLKEPRCLVCRSEPELRTTKHWFFKLTDFKGMLKKFLSKKSLPGNVKNYAVTWLDKLEDWCITRDMDWGVKVPLKEAKDKVLYVWWDAPIGYVSATEAWGKENKIDWETYWKKGKITHFIGKDIIYHHALFWPAMLKAHGKYTLPHSIVAGEYLSLEGKKMSTSRNWVLWVEDFLNTYPADYLRYYLTINTPLTADIDFSWKDFEARINNELSDVLGNFVHRVLVFTEKYFDSKIPKHGKLDKRDNELLTTIKKVAESASKHMETYDFIEALKEVMSLAQAGNQYMNDKEPWKHKEDGTAIYVCACVAKALSVFLGPFLPATAGEIWAQLGFKEEPKKWDEALEYPKAGQKIGKPKPLIQKVEIKEEEPEFSGKKVVVDKKLKEKIKEREITIALAEAAGLKVQTRNMELEREKKKAIVDFASSEVYPTIESYRYMLDKIDKGTEGLSSENLVSFVLDSDMLPNINTAADAYNMVSFKTGLIMGAYDVRAIEGDVQVKVASGKENFIPIGSTEEDKIQPGEYVVADSKGMVITRWLTKENEKVKVDKYTRGVVVCVQGNKGIPQEKVNEVLKEVCEKIVKYCGGKYKILFDGKV